MKTKDSVLRNTPDQQISPHSVTPQPETVALLPDFRLYLRHTIIESKFPTPKEEGERDSPTEHGDTGQ